MFFSEKQLIKKAIQGHAGAWENLVKKNEKAVYNLALRMTGNRDDAMDLTQDVFFDVYRKLSSFRQESSFSTWIRKIAYGKSIDFLRRQKESTQIQEDSVISETDPHRDLIKSDQNRVVLDFLQQLTTEQRLIVELKFFQGQTFDEISQTMNLSANTVKSRFYAAIRNRRMKMEASHVL